ncbi:hypothetical protein [Salinibacter ruber]|uniref:hypothetical protein n=1 Tax=Salinibacter ruber TaxID=146919 RepID=UPI0021698B15|nr:hypothetical protein [Salinibacter ruber]MCS3758184.1 hypothetical protein [Salinibacter ruber]MCS3954837.1 hypothetical protein [Salinibacter ruber]
MFDTGISRAALGGTLSFVVVLLVLVAATGRPAPEADLDGQAEAGQDRPIATASKDTIGPSVEEAREMIVGTWIEDVSDEIGVYEKGPKKRVFTEDGTLKRYRRTDAGTYELEETVQYALVDKNPRTGQRASDFGSLIAYLKTTQPDGDTYYNVVNNVNRKADPPYLSLQYTGASATTVSFSPPSAFK